MDTAGRWARDLFRREQACEVSIEHAVELFRAITSEARADLRVAVQARMDEMRASFDDASFPMPARCEYRYTRWLAIHLRMWDEAEEMKRYSDLAHDAAWECGCRECGAFVDRVEASTRRASCGT
jgi:hypothetical protein